jgi:2-hydroxy-6-oxonona-2,4-dienedioate hydrolase
MPCGSGCMVWHIWQPPVVDVAKKPLLLLHGGSGSWTHWLRNIEVLAGSGRMVYVPDLPGFGDSSTPLHGLDADALPDPLEQGLQQLLGDVPCDVAGFSFGGMVGGLLAEKFPARLSRLVLVGAPGLGIARMLMPLQSWRQLKDAGQRDAAHRNNLAVLMLYDPNAVTDAILRLHAANVERDRMRGRSLARTDVLSRALGTLRCPIDAIYGREDVLYRDRLDILEDTLRQAPNFGRLAIIDKAGHWVQFEQPQAFNAALLQILDGVVKL